jgi:hypothetical protein
VRIDGEAGGEVAEGDFAKHLPNRIPRCTLTSAARSRGLLSMLPGGVVIGQYLVHRADVFSPRHTKEPNRNLLAAFIDGSTSSMDPTLAPGVGNSASHTWPSDQKNPDWIDRNNQQPENRSDPSEFHGLVVLSSSGSESAPRFAC